MSVKNNYWSTLKDEGFYIYACPGGWEIKCGNVINEIYCFKRKRLISKKTFEVRIYRETPRIVRKDARIQIDRIKRVAQSVKSREDYQNLLKRIDEQDWEFIEKNDLKDENLVNWAYNTHTADEYYRLLMYN